ncbi:MAG: hypothetical protein J5635_02905 [Paludibacteraceae bacterium]|nr:hypothetical protein [Paludibacteraceae bacterium]
MKKYKAIFLDWDDTIGDFSNAALKSLRAMYDKHGLNACYTDFEQFYEVYETHNLDLWRRYGLDEVTKDYLEFDRMFYPLCMATKPLSSHVHWQKRHTARLRQLWASKSNRNIVTMRSISLRPSEVWWKM